MVLFSLEMAKEVALKSRGGMTVYFALEHPEDLGWKQDYRPAALWQLPELHSLVGAGDFTCFAFYQCLFGARNPKPTRMLTNSARQAWQKVCWQGSILGLVKTSRHRPQVYLWTVLLA